MKWILSKAKDTYTLQ